MSIQSDIEMLAIETMEVYAKRYGLSGEAVVDLFHKHQVFEKMLVQHEYLHQIDFEEIMEYVDGIMEEGSKELVVYHGSCWDFTEIDLSKSYNRRDFGKGFYTRGLQHGYDVVIGPVADDRTMETVQLYIADILTAEEAVERLKYNKPNNQISFHTKRALKYLKFVGRESYE